MLCLPSLSLSSWGKRTCVEATTRAFWLGSIDRGVSGSVVPFVVVVVVVVVVAGVVISAVVAFSSSVVVVVVVVVVTCSPSDDDS